MCWEKKKLRCSQTRNKNQFSSRFECETKCQVVIEIYVREFEWNSTVLFDLDYDCSSQRQHSLLKYSLFSPLFQCTVVPFVRVEFQSSVRIQFSKLYNSHSWPFDELCEWEARTKKRQTMLKTQQNELQINLMDINLNSLAAARCTNKSISLLSVYLEAAH